MLTTASGALGTGQLSINGQPNAGATVVVGGSETVSGLSGTTTPNGPTVLYIGPGAQLNVHQDTNTTFQGTLVTSGTFSKSGEGTLEVAGPGTMILGGPVTVGDGGTLRLRTAGGAMVASGVVAQVNGSATLELAGSVSNLSAAMGPPIRAAVFNNSVSAAGLLVSGTNQHVGGIDGSGNVVVADGAALTADHIIQAALIIGGTLTSSTTVTINASDAAGRPLDEPSVPSLGAPTFAFAGAAWPASAFGMSAGNSSAMLAAATIGAAGAPMNEAMAQSGLALTSSMAGALSMSGHLVPEPAGWILILLAILPPVMASPFNRRR